MLPYLKYYFSALNKYKVHSPFVFEFLNEILEDDRFYHSFGIIENYRRNLLGNGSKINASGKEQTINQLAKAKNISNKIGEFLFKTVHLYKPKTILTVGANLGIASLYQATPNSKAKLVAIEPSVSIAQQTNTFFKQLGIQNIEIKAGNIREHLALSLKKMPVLDFIYFNDFWGKDTTFAYFETCLSSCNPNSVFVIRSPYDSAESIAFWEAAKTHKKVKLSIDLYDLGFLFFRSEQKEVAHYQLIEYWKKPWVVF